MPTFLVYAIGFLAQGFFSARTLIQWFLSEKNHKVISPSTYWVCSLAGSILLFTYGWFRDDFSIILGQLISYYIYIWNLKAKGLWSKFPHLVQRIIFVLPILAVIFMLNDAQTFLELFFHNTHIPIWLIVFGSAGQVIFTIRFVFQWYYSYKRKQSILPTGFWVISLIGSSIIIAYGIVRADPVLILGQSVGFIAYIRNIIIGQKQSQ